jgi:redox-sensitive bicupin YhaK (pirin superfamily)
MSNIGVIIPERAAHLGGFLVGRLLPFKERRMVGPFVFIDHMGPAELVNGQKIDVPPHPHIGLSTLTYLFEGHIMHRDSLGTSMEISPGEINWMTAGKGIVHSERTPLRLIDSGQTLHGLQIWVALPKELERMDPTFVHLNASEVPAWEDNGVSYKLIAGEALGRKSPVPVYSNLYLIEIKASRKATIPIGYHLFGESGLYILEGQVYSEGHTFTPKQLLVAHDASLCTFEMEAGTTTYLFGGEPFPEERFIHWNFVSSERSLIEEARQRWQDQQFPKVPGETDFVPLPK